MSSQNDAPLASKTFSIGEAMECLGISRHLIYDEMDSGRLDYIKIGRRRLIRAQTLDRYLTEREREAREEREQRQGVANG